MEEKRAGLGGFGPAAPGPSLHLMGAGAPTAWFPL